MQFRCDANVAYLHQADLTRCPRSVRFRRLSGPAKQFGPEFGHQPAFQNAQSLEFGILHNRPPELLIALDETRKFSSVYCLEGRASDCLKTRTEIGIFQGLT